MQAVADVDTGGTDLHAQRAVDAVAKAFGLWVGVFAPRASLFTPGGIVGHHQRVGIEHHTLEARIGAHVHAHLFTQPAGVDVGRGGEEEQPERGGSAQLQTE